MDSQGAPLGDHGTWREVFAILEGRRPQPAIRYVQETPADIASRIRASRRGAVIVSFHYSDFPILLCIPELVGKRCVVLVSRNLLEASSDILREAPASLEFTTELTPQHLRRCQRREAVLLIMADIAVPDPYNTWVHVFGRSHKVTTLWADLALRLELNVVVAVARRSGEGLAARIALARETDGDRYGLVCDAFGIFEEFASDTPELWRNASILPVSRLPSRDDGVLVIDSAMRDMSSCDLEISRALALTLKAEVAGLASDASTSTPERN